MPPKFFNSYKPSLWSKVKNDSHSFISSQPLDRLQNPEESITCKKEKSKKQTEQGSLWPKLQNKEHLDLKGKSREFRPPRSRIKKTHFRAPRGKSKAFTTLEAESRHLEL